MGGGNMRPRKFHEELLDIYSSLNIIGWSNWGHRWGTWNVQGRR